MKVMVYRNLHRQSWSVKDNATRLVVAHPLEVILVDATFRVSQSGRLRVLRERQKNVHAMVVGMAVKTAEDQEWKPVRYNPYRWDSFVDEEEIPVISARIVHLRSDGTVWAAGILRK
jgi:hypothetical protein